MLGKLLSFVEFIIIYFIWWFIFLDFGDDLIIDCVMNVNVAIVILNIKDFWSV